MSMTAVVRTSVQQTVLLLWPHGGQHAARANAARAAVAGAAHRRDTVPVPAVGVPPSLPARQVVGSR